MTRYTPLWEQQGSYPANIDRYLLGALWPAPASSGCAVSAAAAMTVNVAPGTVAVPSQNNTGSTLCHSDGVEQVTLTAAPSSGLNRIDLVTCHPRGNDLDGGANNDFIFDYVTGAAAATATVPATPAGQAALAQILVPGGSAAIVAGNITDVRPSSLAIPPAQYIAWARGPAAQTDVTTITPVPLVTISQTLEPGRYKISGHAQASAVTAAPIFHNCVLSATGGQAGTPYLFSQNGSQILVNATVAGATFTVVNYTVWTPATFSIGGECSASGGSISRYLANSCELLVEQIA